MRSIKLSLFVTIILFSLLSLSSSSPSSSRLSLSSSGQALGCAGCELLVTSLLPLLKTNVSVATISKVAVAVCEVLKPDCTGTQQCQELCQGVVSEFALEVIEIASVSVLSPSSLCVLVKSCTAPEPTNPPPTNTIITSNLTAYEGEKHFASWYIETGIGNILHLSDIHLDEKYTIGAPTQCGLPVCCRNDSIGTGSASQWGAYTCDVSPTLFDNVINYIRNMENKPDFIIYTGDDPAHDIWKQSRERNIAAMNRISSALADALPHVQVIPALGNHEAFPVNQFAGPSVDNWVYSAASSAWSQWLSDDAKRTLEFAGFYTQRIRPGLRVISLHTTLFSSEDFWLFANHSDFAGQLPWFSSVLSGSASLGERCVIIGHAPHTSWVQPFRDQFVQLLKQYKDTIVAIMWGHAHYSRFVLDYDGDVPFALSYVGGSLTPVSFSNPSFTRYSYDRQGEGEGGQLVLDMTRHWFDLTSSSSAPDWNVTQWSLRKSFNMSSTELRDWNEVAQQMITTIKKENTTSQLVTEYVRNYVAAAEQQLNTLSLLCQFVTPLC